ncbi:hypothetical protein SDC9_93659 [bioreactor metagenome]|uniref:Uncharacterized protein n=1 Tax=bioreactor metagenome TaxID=1076179 RepID=A0A645A1N8_9ZZZZ
MLRKFRDNRFKKALSRRKEIVSRVVVNKSFEESRTFLLLFDSTTEEKYNEFTRILSSLQVNNKKVHAIGFHGLPKQPEWCANSIHVSFIGKNDMNSSNIPSDAIVDEYISEPYDVLVDLTYCMNPVFHWITALSAARLKIGAPSRQNQHFFDITIDVENGKTQEDIIKLAIEFQNMFQKRTI